MRRVFAKAWLKVLRIKPIPRDSPVPDRCVIIAAPHSSNWDFPLVLSLAAMYGVRITWLGKEELFRGPMGWVMRRFGGIPVKRNDAGSMVADLAAQFSTRQKFRLVVPVEGTRSRSEYWKSGFYRIAAAAEVPVVFGYVDSITRTAAFAQSVQLSGNVSADMDLVREFYSGKEGLRSGRASIPRLKEEDSPRV